jgi:putative endonuclease
MAPKTYYVYILANTSRTLYVGFTSDLERRVWQHRSRQSGGFTRDYNVTMLVYFEAFPWVDDAIAREKQIKRWNRSKKIWLIEQENPGWLDLAANWFTD